MAFSKHLAERVRNALTRGPFVVEEEKMMGGLTFMVNGKMCVGVDKDDLMVRLGPGTYDVALKKKGCREMDITGKPMRGFVLVGPAGLETKGELDYWLELALDFNKDAKRSTKRTSRTSRQVNK